MTKVQYVLSLAVHWLARALRFEATILEFSRQRAKRYLERQGLGDIVAHDVSYGVPLLDLPDRTKIVDLERLHRLVRSGRFKSIREYGAGASTIVMAHAIAASGRKDIALTTVEESAEWLDVVIKRAARIADVAINGIVATYVPMNAANALAEGSETDLVLSQAIATPPDLIYVDGPTLHAPSKAVRGIAVHDGWREPINVDFLSVAHTMRKGSMIVFDERPASFWAAHRALRRPFWCHSSSLYSVNTITLL